MKKLVVLTLIILSALSLKSQVVTTIPVIPLQNKKVKITFNAAEGTKGLIGYSGDVYVHIGVTINDAKWKKAPAWGDNSAKYKLVRDSQNADLYTLELTPTISEYFGAKESDVITQLCMVFRSSDTKKEGKGTGGTDIFYDVKQGGLSQLISKPSKMNSFYNIGETVNVQVNSVDATLMTLYIDNKQVKISNIDVLDFSYLITKGVHVIKSIVTDGTKIVSDSIIVASTPIVTEQELPESLEFGINYINSTTVSLVLNAPYKQSVFVIGDFNLWMLNDNYLMKRTSDGNTYWLTIKNLEPNKEYAFYYLVDGELTIADPYSHKVLDASDSYIPNETYPNLKKFPSNFSNFQVSILQTNKTKYKWLVNNFVAPDINSLSIYELLVRDFTVGPEGKEGNYKGVIDNFKYIKGLGVNAIEFLPVMEFEGNNSWGYNPNFLLALDKAYGTEKDFKILIDSCHANGIAVILDIVLNHAFGSSPMARLYNVDGGYGNPTEQNPWFNVKSKHPFNVGYDINHESQLTKDYVKRVVQYWIKEYNIDGYRFDLSKGFTQTDYGDDVAAWSGFDQGRINILKEINGYIKEVKPSAYVILEHLGGDAEERVLTANGMITWGIMHHQYKNAAEGNLNNSDFSRIKASNRGYENQNLVGYMESHDEERIMVELKKNGKVSEWPNYDITNFETSLKRMEISHAFILPLPGPKMIWQFGELGYDISINEGGRTSKKPVKWEYFDNENRKKLYLAIARMNYLKTHNDIFKTSEWWIDGDADSFEREVFLKEASSNTFVTIVGNFDIKNKNVTVNFQGELNTWYYDFVTGDSIKVTQKETSIKLAASEYRIYSNKKLNGWNLIPDDKSVTAIEKMIKQRSENFDVYYIGSDELEVVVDSKKCQQVFVDVYNFQGGKVSSFKSFLVDGQKGFSFAFSEKGNFIVRVFINNKYYVKKVFVNN